MHAIIHYHFAPTLHLSLTDVCPTYLSGSLASRNSDKLIISNSLIPRVGRHLNVFWMRLKHNLVYICELFKKKMIFPPSMINAPHPNIFRYAVHSNQ